MPSERFTVNFFIFSKVVAGFESDVLGRVHTDDVDRLRSAGTIVGMIQKVDVLHVLGHSQEPLRVSPTCPVYPCLLPGGPTISEIAAKPLAHASASGSTPSHGISQKTHAHAI